jgi:hypothetical protein
VSVHLIWFINKTMDWKTEELWFYSWLRQKIFSSVKVKTSCGAKTTLYSMVTRYFPEINMVRGMKLTTYICLVPRLRVPHLSYLCFILISLIRINLRSYMCLAHILSNALVQLPPYSPSTCQVIGVCGHGTVNFFSP